MLHPNWGHYSKQLTVFYAVAVASVHDTVVYVTVYPVIALQHYKV